MDRLEDVIESMENGYFDEHFMYAIRSMERGNSHRLPLRVPIRLTGESEKIGYIEIARDGSLPETVEKNHRFYRRRDGEPTHALPVYEPSLIAKVS